MAIPNNILQQVITYQKASLASLQNQGAFISTANKKFKDFQNFTGNLGDTVSFDLPYRFTTVNSLIASFEGTEQRKHNLTVDQEISTSVAFNAQQFIFNVEQYMTEIGKGAVAELGSKIEAQIARNTIINHTYRFYGAGGTIALDSYQQLAQALAYFRNYGAPRHLTKGYIPDIAVPSIIGSGLNQFVMRRNEEIANSWELGSFSNCDWYQSNLLPAHFAGSVGNNSLTLTVTEVDDPNNITQITCSGADPNDPNAIKSGDLLVFADGVIGKPDVRYLTWVGHQISANPVQVRATADASSDGAGNVTFNIYPALVAPAGKNQNLSTAIQLGMQLTALPDHIAGLLTAADPIFLGMPQLPDQTPFPTSSVADEVTGASLRLTHGALLGQNTNGLIYDAIWGSTMVDEYTMRLVFPINL